MAGALHSALLFPFSVDALKCLSSKPRDLSVAGQGQTEKPTAKLGDIAGNDGEIDGLEFDPTDPGSIDRVISDMEAKIDERVGSARNNPFVAPLAHGMKNAYRQKILELAAQKRMEGSNE